MSEAKHTPGPWRAFDGSPSKIEIICGDRSAPNRWPSAGIRVAEIRFRRSGRGGSFVGNETDAANARLIAAAPDMLAALKWCCERLEMSRQELLLLNEALDKCGDVQNEASDETDQNCIAQARAAIANADSAVIAQCA